MSPAGFDILHENGPCLVVGKPPGLLTQAPAGIDSLEARVRAFLQARDGRAPGPAHRDSQGMVSRCRARSPAVRKLSRISERRSPRSTPLISGGCFA